MNTEAHNDTADRHALVTRKRNVIMLRLARALDEIDRKRRRVTAVVGSVASLLPGVTASASTQALAIDGEHRDERVGAHPVLLGALAGGALFALALYVEHRRREHGRPMQVLQHAWLKLARAPQPSLVRRLVRRTLGSLVLSLAQTAARVGIQRMLEPRARQDDHGIEILDGASDAPEPRFVGDGVTLDHRAAPPREQILPPAGGASPDPIIPALTPLRDFA